MFFSFVLNLVYFINMLVIFNLIFRDRRKIQSTIGWLLILTLFPIGGFVLFILFGRKFKKDNLFRLKKAEDLALKSVYCESYEVIKNIKEEDDEIVYKNKNMISTFLKMDNALLTSGNSVDIHVDSEVFFNTLMDELGKAEKFINIEYYIFKNDNIGNRIIKILEEKVKEGVEVRFLYDAMGSRSLSEKDLRDFKDLGGKVAVFFPSMLKYINFNANYRNHRKIVVIDGKVGFVGGYNIGDEYLGKNKKFGNWRDTHIMVKGPAVNTLNLRFQMDWRHASNEKIELDSQSIVEIENEGNVYIQMVSSGPDLSSEEIKYGYLKMIQKAEKYVYIQSPYLILDESILESLALAALGGVDVRIMIPSKPDHPFVYWATYSYAGELLKSGAKVYIYDENAFLHAKTIVCDDNICSIGTANMDIRSFSLNFEVNAFIYSPDIAIKQRNIFIDDITNSKELTLDNYNNRSRKIRIKESISRLLSPVL